MKRQPNHIAPKQNLYTRIRFGFRQKRIQSPLFMIWKEYHCTINHEITYTLSNGQSVVESFGPGVYHAEVLFKIN